MYDRRTLPADADDAIRIARLFTFGHEVTHAFDFINGQRDAFGNALDPSANTTHLKQLNGRLKERSGDHLAAPLEQLKKVSTVNEDFCDIGGLDLALALFLEIERKKPLSEQNRKIGQFTPLQLFFVSYAQLLRTKSTPEDALTMALGDEHSPGKYRINNTLRDCEEFLKAFQVRPGDGMWRPPGERIQVWDCRPENIKKIAAHAIAAAKTVAVGTMRVRLRKH
jgi:putative endopeptidase